MKPIHSCKLRLFADYRQFYVWDPIASNREAPEEWDEEDVRRRIKVAAHVVVVCPERDMEVPVTVRLYSKDPGFLISAWDHIAEAPLVVDSGEIEIHECTGTNLAKFTVKPDTYRVRALHAALSSISPDGLEGDDSYTIDIFPCEMGPLIVTKQWLGNGEQGAPTDARSSRG